MLGVTPAGLLVGRCCHRGTGCSGGGCGRPASIVCTRAAIHRRAVEHMDARTVDGRVVVGDAVAREPVLLPLVVFCRRCRRRRRRR